MIHEVLQFALRIAFRCVLHRCGSLDIRRWKLYNIQNNILTSLMNQQTHTNIQLLSVPTAPLYINTDPQAHTRSFGKMSKTMDCCCDESLNATAVHMDQVIHTRTITETSKPDTTTFTSSFFSLPKLGSPPSAQRGNRKHYAHYQEPTATHTRNSLKNPIRHTDTKDRDWLTDQKENKRTHACFKHHNDTKQAKPYSHQ